ncbi:extracellular solute-binding protein, partial [Fredinandcohnia onubensis]
QAFTENDPDGNGKKDTIGITDRSDLVYGAFKSVSSWFGTPNNWGEKDGKLLPEFMFDEYLDTMDFIKDIREKGYMNSDFPVTSKDDQQALFKNGTAGMYIGAIGDVQGLYNDAVQLNPDVVLDVQNKITGPDGKFGIWAIPGYGNMVLFPKSSVETEKELKDILEFYDFIASPEGANLIYWGVEGEHYEVKDGK